MSTPVYTRTSTLLLLIIRICFLLQDHNGVSFLSVYTPYPLQLVVRIEISQRHIARHGGVSVALSVVKVPKGGSTVF